MSETTCQCGSWAAQPTEDKHRREWLNRERRSKKVLRGRRTFDCARCHTTMKSDGTAVPAVASGVRGS